MEKKMPLTLSFLLCIIVMIIFNPLIVYSDPDPMARPTRPKAFTSADELKRYLDLVRDYYSLSGKARYGKRSKVIPINDDNPLEILRLPINSNDLIKGSLKNNHIIERLNKIHYFSPIDNEKSLRDIVNDLYGINEMIAIKNQDNQKKDQKKKFQEEEEEEEKKEKDKEIEEKEEEEEEEDHDDNDRDNDLKIFQKHQKRDLPYLYEAMAKYYDDFQ